MFCELKNKEVELIPTLPIKDGRGDTVRTFYTCTGCEIEVAGMKLKRPCDMTRDKDCLLNRIR